MSGPVGDNVYRASGVIATAGGGGSVSWQTDSIKTAEFTAVAGEGYFCNTSGGAFAALLPAATIGDIIGFSDYASSWDSNNLTITPNGSEDINAVNDDYVASTKGLTVTLIYVDATRGWKSIMGSDADATGAVPAFMVATVSGACNTLATSGDFKIATFLGPGGFCVSCAGNAAGNNKTDYLVVAGGGSGGAYVTGNAGASGGGGAGGFRESPGTASGCYTTSPLGTAPATALTVTAQCYSITVGGGGASVSSLPGRGNKGSDSIYSTITSTGGGFGGQKDGSPPQTDYGGGPGGSGGGGGGTGSGAGCRCGGTGNDPATPVAQGKDGGDALGTTAGAYSTGGGGGATAQGVDGANPSGGGCGGAGATTCISTAPVGYAGGGGGSSFSSGPAGSATDGGGAGGSPGASPGTTNRGGGGGGNGSTIGVSSGAGGSGIVYIRYKIQ